MSDNIELPANDEDDTQGHVHPGEFPGFPTGKPAPPKPKQDDSKDDGRPRQTR
jgi:hypothetical protein